MSNLDRYKRELADLIQRGDTLIWAIQWECLPKQIAPIIKDKYGDKAQEFVNSLPSFVDSYQSWYSEAKALIKQLLPDRLFDFVRHYEKPKPRKELTNENYRPPGRSRGFPGNQD